MWYGNIINRVLFSDFYSNEIGVLEIMSDYDYGETNSQYWKDLDWKVIKQVSQK